MFYQIVEINIVKDTNHVYLLVIATEGNRQLTEEFIIGRQPTGKRIITDTQGRLRTADGKWVDLDILDPEQSQPKWEYETFTIDLVAEYRAVIEPTMKRLLAEGYTGDKTTDAKKLLYKNGMLVRQRSIPIERGQFDPLGILAREDIQALQGTMFEAAL